jgi:sulfide:quinone oxidoreductase
MYLNISGCYKLLELNGVMMMKNLVILGAGTAGTMMANKMLESLPEGWKITLVDQDDQHVYQPGLLFLPFGMYSEEEVVRSREAFVHSGIEYLQQKISDIGAKQNIVSLADGTQLNYDVLIVATGAITDPSKTEGMLGDAWYKDIFDFYTLEGASALAKKLDNFEKGRLVLNIVEMPIKCPVAPLEFLFLADDFFSKKGCRDEIELVFATPLDGAFTKPKSSEKLGGLMALKNIKVESNFNIEKVQTQDKKIVGFDGRELDYDLLVTVPLHSGVEVVSQSDISDDWGFVDVDKHTLQSKKYNNVFAIGDATNVPASKAGSVAHFQSEVLAANILDFINGRKLRESFDGHSNCFIETGKGKAMLIDFNYTTEPLPGKYPMPGLGPFTLLGESEVNHWGKLAFKWVYWNMLLSGKELPLDHQMLMFGKRG